MSIWCHTKICKDQEGGLHLSMQKFTALTQLTTSQCEGLTCHSHPLQDVSIPDWIDDSPPEGDPSILNMQPRQPNASVIWLVQDHDNFLSELIHLKGQGSVSDVFTGCGTLDPCFQCKDCFGDVMYCQDCIYWMGKLGLWIQLGHRVGDSSLNHGNTRLCPPSRDDSTVIHSNGIHSVNLDFCGCKSAEAPFQQLLCICWFPTSSEKPCTATTFSVLQHFHLLSSKSKISTFKFYQSLSHSSDNTGPNLPKDCYEQFLHIIHQWHHLKLLKHTGHGHDPLGISSTKQGNCALLHPACPHPGKNLPPDWRSVKPEKQFLYSLFVALNTNFQLKQRAVSKDSSDPSLSEGWAYFVEESTYKSYLSHHTNDIQEKIMCLSHNAINMADTKANQGLDTTSVGIVVCARHGMMLVNSIGDLQKGERYVNMDYLFALALRGVTVNKLNISYDIACQWHKSLYQRMMSLPQDHVSFFVPKFHLPAHITPCQWKYSFNWRCGVGCTDGEVPECGWAHINPVGSSTKVMGPGHCHDTIDDFFGDWNWKKTIALGSTILWKISKVIPQQNEHQEDFEELKKSLSIKYPEQLSLWQQQIEDWEDDPSKPNPFEVKEISITQANICLQLVKEEAQVTQSSLEPPLHPNITPSILISAGVDLEDQQSVLLIYFDLNKLGLHATDAQKAKLQQHRNALTHCIEVWTKIHVLYVPSTATFGKTGAPEDIPLYLPLQIKCKFLCSHNLKLVKFQLWEGQANDALNELQQGLQSRDCFLHGQGTNTHACNCLKNVNAKIDLSVAKYHAAHHVLCMLGPLLGKVGWKTALQLLADDDIHSMSGEDDQASEGRQWLSWIWLACGYMVENVDDKSDHAIWIKWYKARARAHCWAEEFNLLLEDKQWTLQFLEWDATCWAGRAKTVTDWDKLLDKGL
ncbi:hypothetical protein F5141DRAFT_1188096 [Pisolithus sp. B1]|nr:hypothetical protein F5141DRAFT_1188096 [Pisolithus sp. B1]